MPPVFVLDHDFPNPAIDLPRLIPDLELRPLRRMHPDLVAETQDWEILQKLRSRGGVDGFITLDRGMLSLDKEMVVLHQTRLSMVVFEGTKNDPLVAWGLLMVHAPAIASQFVAARPQLWTLRKPGTGPPGNPEARIQEIARQLGVSRDSLYRRNRLSQAQLSAR